MKRIITLTLLSILSVGLFANGTSEDLGRSITSSHERIEFETIGKLQVEPNSSIVSFFANHDIYPVPAEYLAENVDLRSVPEGVLDNIDILLGVLIDGDLDESDSDDADALDTIFDDSVDLKASIVSQLNSNIVHGQTEYVFMTLGRNIYSTKLDY